MAEGKAAGGLSAKERLERKISLAQERDTRVIIARTNDTHRILDIARQADRGIRILRNNMLIRFGINEVAALLNRYQNAIEELHIIAHQICTRAGVPYRPPRGLELPPNEENAGEAAKKGVDELISGAYGGGDGEKKK